jgi:hypothetical protein
LLERVDEDAATSAPAAAKPAAQTPPEPEQPQLF